MPKPGNVIQTELRLGKLSPVPSVEEIYGLLWSAVANQQPIAATYGNERRLLCPHRLGRNKNGQLRVLCYQHGGATDSGLQTFGSSGNWRCLAVDKLSQVEMQPGPWRTGGSHSRPASCVPDADIDAEDPN